MCVHDIGSIEVAFEDFYVYKYVRRTSNRRWCSFISKSRRNPQTRYATKGKVLYYSKGVPITSSLDTTPGLYCYVQRHPYGSCMVALVPKGTRFRKAEGGTIVLAETIVPQEFIYEP